MTRPQVPRASTLVGKFIDALVAARPAALPFINLGAGRYADLVTGLEGQCALFVRQMASEVTAARMRSARGDALTQLAGSEFTTLRQTGTTAALGTIYLARTGALAGGAIEQGTRFARPAATSYVPAIPAAAYVAARDVSCAQGASVLEVPIYASLNGSSSNAPYYDGDNTGGGVALPTISDPLFDAFTVTGFDMAGGSDGEDDDDLVNQMAANAVGSYGPTIGAIVAAALSGVGVHRAAVFDVAVASDGSPCAYTGVAIADATWASSSRWTGAVAQIIANSGQGIGGQVITTGITNARIRIAPTVNLRSGDDLNDVSEIDQALLTAATSYFDDRPDFYTWTTRGLRGALSRAHPKILSCSTVSVYALGGTTPLAEPPSAPTATQAGLQVTHCLLAQNGVTPTYQAAA